MTNSLQPSYQKAIEDSQLVHVDALETLFLLTDYGEQGAMDMVHKAKLITNMAENERIIKINMLRGRGRENEILPNSDIGKTVYIHHRSVGGTLTDVHDTKKHDGFFLAIDGRIYPVSGYDFIIISEPTDDFEERSVLAERDEEAVPDIPSGMENVEWIGPMNHGGGDGETSCIEVRFVNGFAVCSHFNSDDDNMLENIPKLRHPSVEE